MKRALVLLLFAIGAGTPLAAPFIPADDREVLERLPFRSDAPAMRELRLMHEQLAQRPRDLALAVALARRYIELGRVTGDPRYAGYAQAALGPWWSAPEPPRDVLVLRATLHQRVHAFDAALADLALALARNPADVQARLTRATVLQVRGELEAARRDCVALHGLTDDLVSATCLAGVDGSNGRLQESYRSLRAALAGHPASDPTLRAWVLGGLAEMAARAGLAQDAERYFSSALSADPSDQYLLAAYADFLLDRGRAREAAALVQPHTRADGLLLRYALASKAQRAPDAAQQVAELRARFDASRRRGDRAHLREEARFTLHLGGDALAALALALQNWAVQKEPADARILLESALAAGDMEAVRRMQAWLSISRLEDVQLNRLLAARNPDR